MMTVVIRRLSGHRILRKIRLIKLSPCFSLHKIDEVRPNDIVDEFMFYCILETNKNL